MGSRVPQRAGVDTATYRLISLTGFEWLSSTKFISSSDRLCYVTLWFTCYVLRNNNNNNNNKIVEYPIYSFGCAWFKPCFCQRTSTILQMTTVYLCYLVWFERFFSYPCCLYSFNLKYNLILALSSTSVLLF